MPREAPVRIITFDVVAIIEYRSLMKTIFAVCLDFLLSVLS
jgi:hypothetical protein